MDSKTIRLQKSASSGNIAEVRKLIEQKVNLNARDGYGNTAVHHAIKGNQVQILLLLLNSGADVNAVNDGGCTALHVAVKSGREKCVSELLKRNIHVNQVNKEGLTELMLAMMIDEHIDKGHRNRSIEQLLKFPRVNLLEISYDRLKQTALHYAAQYGNLFAVTHLLKKDPAIYNIRNAFGNLALHNAAAYGHPEIIQEFRKIFPKFDINVKGFNSRTPLQMAVMSHRFSTIEFLIELKADCNVPDQEGNTALHTAVNMFNCCCTKGFSSKINCQKEVDHGVQIKKIRESLSTTVHNKCYNLALVAFLIETGNAFIDVANNAGDTPLDLIYNDKLISNLLKSVLYQKLERNCFQENNYLNVVEATEIRSASLNNEEEQLNDLNSDIIKTTDVNVTLPDCSETCGQRIAILEERIEKLESIIKKMRIEFKHSNLCLEPRYEVEFNHKEDNNLCGCLKSATYSLLCGHNLCDDCYENNSSNCITCNNNMLNTMG